ncbi:CHASE2 domain-containing protein [Marinivivus vitaminiproducens]|uniref:CHASE2 domain-containing protein n=1 Tax=Marinivivus vitaminiproducens TaxID=3035935 RepID=UPI0027A9BF48|nr:adenylate/guanylate cyclase domain-containing protein [Geminicoccaceae bacterium SCSIO 64248]
MAKSGRRSGFVWRGRIRALIAAGLAAALLGAAVAAFPRTTAEAWREAASDALVAAFGTASDERIVVVAIDQPSLIDVAPWPWPRENLARLVEAVASAGPAVVALDILLNDPDRNSPVALARALAERYDDPAAVEVLAKLPDPDDILASAFAKSPVVLAALLDDHVAAKPGPARRPSIVLSGPAPSLSPWFAQGISQPYPPLQAQAEGVGVASLASGPLGRVRDVPLFATSAGLVQPGFALEAVRVFEGAAGFILVGGERALHVGPHVLPISDQAGMRIVPSDRARWHARTVSARDVLAGRVPAERLRGQLVLIGGTAPAQGGLRPTARDPLAPSVQIQADAIATMLGKAVPVRPPHARWIEAGASALLGLSGAVIGLVASPGLMVAGALALALVWAAGSVLVLLSTWLILDPVTPGVFGVVATAAAGLAATASAHRAAVAIRRRFEQHLAPGVVARIVENPKLLKLAGERREVTALFTDLEGFTALADRLEPEVLVDLLDRYFTGVTGIVVAHGGMVDKIIGDAVHALFNVPVDQADHASCAIRCAQAIHAFAENFRRRPENAAIGLARTRIGIETGIAVVGDVGTGAKLDYTAHGSAVNTASRLEALNKAFGTSICVGPVCRSKAQGIAFRALGKVEVRGRGLLEVFEPLDAAVS